MPHDRRADLDQLLRILPPSPAWSAWLAATGELPPDFAALPAHRDLPDPLLRTHDGREIAITSADEWRAHRAELQGEFQRWMLGTLPPLPDSFAVEDVRETPFSGGTARTLTLRFGARAALRVELLIPHGERRFPVFLTQMNHRSWALIALRRGYAGALYAACDDADDTPSFDAEYPGVDWSLLARRAWAARVVVSLLLTLPEVDARRIVLTGHSRNGKSSVIAAAFDERIAAVIASSAGAFGVVPARLFSEAAFGEGVELMTRVFPAWFHPRLRFFAGREERLPVDMHQLIALVAPRSLLLATAVNDVVESTWAVERARDAAARVYRLFGAEDALSIDWRAGGHETYSEGIERYLDWADAALGLAPAAAPPTPVHPAAISAPAALPVRAWVGVSTRAAWDALRPAVRAALAASLGDAPPAGEGRGSLYGREAEHVAALLEHRSERADVTKTQVVFGDYINADLYRPAAASGRLPAVLWLPPLSFATGYRAGYFVGEQVYDRLAGDGYAVCCWDPVGMGRRHAEAVRFYARYPRWSLLGRLLADSQAALAMLRARDDVDPARIYAVGYGLGAYLALALAGDDGLAGAAAVCPPLGTSYRAWGHGYPLLPESAALDDAARLRSDLAVLMACSAPRPLLVVAPSLRADERRREPEAVAAARAIYRLYDAEARLTCQQPEDYDRLSTPILDSVRAWLRDAAALDML